MTPIPLAQPDAAAVVATATPSINKVASATPIPQPTNKAAKGGAPSATAGTTINIIGVGTISAQSGAPQATSTDANYTAGDLSTRSISTPSTHDGPRSSGDLEAEERRLAKRLQDIQQEMQTIKEDHEVATRLHEHGNRNVETWRRQNGKSNVETQAELDIMLQQVAELKTQRQQLQAQYAQLEKESVAVRAERQQLERLLNERRHTQSQASNKLKGIDAQLSDIATQLQQFKTAYVEAARLHMNKLGDSDVAAQAADYRAKVKAHPEADEAVKQLNLQAAEILDLLLQQRQLALKLGVETHSGLTAIKST